MAYEVDKPEPCVGCGEPTFRRARNTREALCVPCAIKKAVDVQIQMKNRSGPYYEKWRKAMARTFHDEGTATLPPGNLPEQP